VRLVPEAQLKTVPQVGARVSVVAVTQQDGSLEASVVAPAPTPIVAGTPDESPTAPAPTQRQTATAQDASTLPAQTPTTPVPPPTATQVAATSEPSAQPSASPTPTATDTRRPPTRTSTPTNTPAPSATSTPSATDTATPTTSPTATATWTPSATPTEAPPHRVKVRIEGAIDEINVQYWVVDGRRVEIRTDTHINQTAAEAQVGGWAIVQAIVEPDGQTVAQEITVVRGSEVAPEPQEFSGAIEALGYAQWTIGGRAVLLTPQTTIQGTPTLGAVAHVLADEYPDGRLVARTIRVEVLEVVQFAGIIEDIQADRWVVSGQPVLIAEDTLIEGTPAIGALADVEAVAAADGTLTARRVHVQDTAPQSAPE